MKSQAVGLFLLAFLGRALFLGDARWTSEESYFFGWIHDYAAGLKWDGLGTPVSGSAGSHPGPWFFAVLAPFAWLSPSPWAIAIGVALLDSVAVVLAWLGLRNLLNEGNGRAAWIAGLFLALSPWALLYGDRPWNSNLVSLPAGLILFGMGRWWRQSCPRGLGLAVLAAAVFPSFHLSAPLYWLPILLLLYLGRRRGWRGLGLGLVLGLLVQVPYLRMEFSNGFRNSAALLAENKHAHRSHSNSLLALSWPLRMTTPAIGYHAQQGFWRDYEPNAALARPNSSQGRAWWRIHGGPWILVVISGLLLAVYAWIRWLQTRPWRQLNEHPFSLLLITGTVTGWCLILFASRRAYPHYLQPLLPLYVGVLGLAIAGLERRWPRPSKVGLCLLLLMGVGLVSRYYERLDRPYGLKANLTTLNAMDQLGGGVQPIFCGKLTYRNSQQLQQIARISHPQLELNDPHSLYLVHLDSPDLPADLYRQAIWHRREQGQWMALTNGPLPRSLKALDCGS